MRSCLCRVFKENGYVVYMGAKILIILVKTIFIGETERVFTVAGEIMQCSQVHRMLADLSSKEAHGGLHLHSKAFRLNLEDVVVWHGTTYAIGTLPLPTRIGSAMLA